METLGGILGEPGGVHQEELLSCPKVFNVAVNSVFWHWIFLIVEDESVIQGVLVHAVGRNLGVLCADGVLMVVNVDNSKTMTFQLGAIRAGMSEDTFGWCSKG